MPKGLSQWRGRRSAAQRLRRPAVFRRYPGLQIPNLYLRRRASKHISILSAPLNLPPTFCAHPRLIHHPLDIQHK